MITIGFADLLVGLHAGKIEGHGLNDLQQYRSDFMDHQLYPKDAIDVLYVGFRHKIAHLGHPYAIFDTRKVKGKNSKLFASSHQRYAWAVYASPRKQPLTLERLAASKLVKKRPLPWPMNYDAVIRVSVRSLSRHLVASVLKPNGYLARLESDPASLKRFMDCMEDFYPH